MQIKRKLSQKSKSSKKLNVASVNVIVIERKVKSRIKFKNIQGIRIKKPLVFILVLVEDTRFIFIMI